MRIEDLRSKGLILYEVISGSKAYGTNKPTSDTDIRGVYLAPLEDVLGFNYQAQVADDKNDVVFYELKRFLELIEKQNPNILEMLYIPEDCVVYKHPLMDDILAHRHQFLTKTCCNSFAGYAVSQIKKAKGLNKKINYPEPVMRKSPLDFCYFMVNEKSIPAREYLTERGYDQSFCGLVALDHMRFTYAVYYDRAGQLNAKHGTQIPTLAKFKGIIQSEEDSNDVSLSALPLEYPHFPIAHMQFNKDAYQVHCRIYLDYTNWVANRNPDRYQVTIENGNDYDAKSMMHCIRLIRVAKEIATEGVVKVRRPDRDELMLIRNGLMEYETLLAEAEQAIGQLDNLYAACDLPDSVDSEFMSQLLIALRKNIYKL